MTLEPRTARCLTCRATFTLRPFVDDEGTVVVPAAYCSIHCEHYAGLARAAQHARAPGEA